MFGLIIGLDILTAILALVALAVAARVPVEGRLIKVARNRLRDQAAPAHPILKVRPLSPH